MFSARNSRGHTPKERTRPGARFDAPPRRMLLPMPCGVRVGLPALNSNPLKFPLSGYFKVIQGDSTCFKGFFTRIFFIGSLAPGNLRPSAPSLRTPPLFRIENFSGAWRLALGTLPSSILHPLPSVGLHPVCEKLIRVENHLVQTFHKPSTNQKSGPKIRGYKPKSNRHKPKNVCFICVQREACAKGLIYG